MHKFEKNKKKADRIKTIILLNDDFTYEQIAKILLLDERTIKSTEGKYVSDGEDKFLEDNYVYYRWKLTKEQEQEVDKYVDENVLMDSKKVSDYIEENYWIKYTKWWIVELLHRLWFVYKKAKWIPAKANLEKQEEHIKLYNEIKDTLKENEVILFTDWVHPTLNTILQYGWIKKWKEKEIQTSTGRNRININWAYNVKNQEVITITSESINAQSTINLYKKIEKHYSNMEKIYIFRDNAKYYSNKEVQEYLKTSKIKEIPLPTYSPNLNPIERLWLFMKKEVLYNKYYETPEQFTQAIMNFFENIVFSNKERLKTFITDSFQSVWF